MDAGTNKRQTLWLVIAVSVACVLAWKIPPLLTAPRMPATAVKAAPVPHAPRGSVLVTVNMVGFDPAEIPAQAGQPLKLAFFRPDANNCASEVIFPDLGIRKQLPPGETTLVDLTPPKTGSLGFACGMNMLKGKLIVR